MKVPVSFFAAGRPHAQLDASTAHFRSLRSTRASQRAKAIAFVEQVWELAYALEKRVQFPPVQLPGFFEGEFKEPIASDPVLAARLIRSFWGLGSGPIPHLVRSMEQSGLIVTLIPFAGPDTPRIDAFSTSRLPRPIAVLTPDRANDVFRHRFTAAHELGHILLHSNSAPGDLNQEREADVFAAELLTPRDVILPELPSRIDFSKFEQLSRTWGVSVKSLIYRSREVGLISEPTARRGYQRLAQLRESGYLLDEPVSNYDGEKPVLLKKAFDLAEQSHGLSLASLADELKWPIARVRELLGEADARPTLRLV
jgi:Zn-dependent peptidase ImmA (M78 family)